MKKWRKLGRIFELENLHPRMKTHAANPTVFQLGQGYIRVYFSARDSEKRASIGWAVFDLNNLAAGALEVSKEPILTPGEPGTFDDSGVSMGCLAKDGEKLRLYYLGWNLGVTVPWRNSVGMAVSEDGGLSFKRNSLAPLLDRCCTDPYSISYPWVLCKGVGDWLIWYGSNLSWGSGKNQEEMAHVIKIGSSKDGLIWHREGKIALEFKGPEEYAMSKPCVIKDGETYRMWYSFRGKAYNIGYAESHDGKTWTRRDESSGISVSDSGWDSQSIEYPCIFDDIGARWMLYNGNKYGLSGFGLAVQE